MQIWGAPLTRQWTHCQSSLFQSQTLPTSFLFYTAEGISYQRRKQGVPLCKWLHWEKSAQSFTDLHSLSRTPNKEEAYAWKPGGQRGSHSRVVPVSSALPIKRDLAVRWWGCVLARPLSPSSSLCLFSLSASLNWGQGSLGPILLCWRKIANLGYSGSKSFIKELICYSLPFTHSPFSHTLPFFHWLSVPRSDFLSCSFLWLFMLCSPPRPLITKPIPNTVG